MKIRAAFVKMAYNSQLKQIYISKGDYTDLARSCDVITALSLVARRPLPFITRPMVAYKAENNQMVYNSI